MTTNTLIQIRQSSVTSTPGDGVLASGELAISYSSEKLFVGNATGTGVQTIGGKYYTDIIDAASAANGASTLVKRNAEGIITSKAFTGTLYGNANTATQLNSGKSISLTGDATGSAVFDGSSNVSISVDLSDTGVTPGVYGSASAVAAFTVDVEGRITSASNVALGASGSFDISADSGTTSTLSAGEKLEVIGGDGIATTVTNVGPGVNVSIDLDSTVVRTTGTQSIGGEKTFTGNVTFSGVVTTVNTQEINLADNIIVLNSDISNATAPTQDAGLSVNRGSSANVSVYWSEADDKWVIFDGSVDRYIATNTDIATADSKTTSAFAAANTAQATGAAAFGKANTNATNITTVDSKTTSAFAAANTAQTTAVAAFAKGNTALSLAQVGYGQANTATTNAAAADSKAVSAFAQANTALTDARNASAMTSGTVASARIAGSYTGITGVGTLTAGTWTASVIGAQYGGTGQASPTLNNVLIGNGTGAMLLSGAPTEGKIFQGAANGRPVFADISCGTF